MRRPHKSRHPRRTQKMDSNEQCAPLDRRCIVFLSIGTPVRGNFFQHHCPSVRTSRASPAQRALKGSHNAAARTFVPFVDKNPRTQSSELPA
ncbi:hypothetical protein EVAR_86376_1 [Eumeta japonica]|uniref:Uncharacterized protein n=1 Tax=Eumeta variegata TaxID=151549 RepID=A0A4C1WAB5_EUMVA|nr:hypothetical protein EVAR_86376_1 [Eumeta japonica]